MFKLYDLQSIIDVNNDVIRRGNQIEKLLNIIHVWNKSMTRLNRSQYVFQQIEAAEY